MKAILNKTRNSSERYTLISGSMGSYGEPSDSPNHEFEIAIGVNGRNGYRGYSSVSYFLTEDKSAPEEAKQKCREILRKIGYDL